MTEPAPPKQTPQPPEWPGTVVHGYLSTLRFLIGNTSRDPAFTANHLLFYLADDFIQSAVSIGILAREGGLSVAKRELRFIIESSIKICYVQQHRYHSSVEDKLKEFDKVLSSTNISIKKDLKLDMLQAGSIDTFTEEVGRLYGKTSQYVHLTPAQILERIAIVGSGRSIGYETPAESDELCDLVSRGLALSLVLLFHSVPAYVAGDWLVDSDGSTVTSYFLGSRFIAEMDSYFDYKAERQSILDTVRQQRASHIKF